jgi:hypothetical protein
MTGRYWRGMGKGELEFIRLKHRFHVVLTSCGLDSGAEPEA